MIVTLRLCLLWRVFWLPSLACQGCICLQSTQESVTWLPVILLILSLICRLSAASANLLENIQSAQSVSQREAGIKLCTFQRHSTHSAYLIASATILGNLKHSKKWELEIHLFIYFFKIILYFFLQSLSVTLQWPYKRAKGSCYIPFRCTLHLLSQQLRRPLKHFSTGSDRTAHQLASL